MNDSQTRYLHFTLGPVQGFVAQARRTRDLWAGSFMLSYLSGQAMSRIIEAGGDIIFPYVGKGREINDPLLKALRDVSAGKTGTPGQGWPSQGSLPNRFKARIPLDFDPRQAVTAVQKHWTRIADAVWEEYFAPLADRLPEITRVSKGIWDRQIGSFWDIAWVIGEDEDLLERRKNWRTFVPSAESGSKCTLMSEFQELSGYERNVDRKKQNDFWQTVRSSFARQGLGLELREDERLCAVALVKRLYPRIGEKTVGWKLATSFPSTAAIAALPWVDRQLLGRPEHCLRYVSLAEGNHSEQQIANCLRVRSSLDARREQPGLILFATLEGPQFFENALSNDRLWPDLSRAKRQNLIRELSGFQGAPSPFYALLIMDGDRLGALLRGGQDSGERVSRSLARFTANVRQVVEEQSGFLVYAGGDDVLALLPLDTALEAAIALRESYRAAFAREYPSAAQSASISAGIVYAHYGLPLRDVMRTGHWLLDAKAKEESGRDSLAVTVLRSSGPGFLWTAPWDHVLRQDSPSEKNRIDELADYFTGENGKVQLTASFIYNLRARYELLAGAEEFDEEFYLRVFTAEYVRSVGQLENPEKTKRLLEKLFAVCQRVYRTPQAPRAKDAADWSIDGAQYVRFLAEKGAQ